MSKLINIVILYGGKTGEHEVSLRSAAAILSKLDINKYNVIPIGIDKNGQCFINNYIELSQYKDILPVKTNKSKKLSSLYINGKFVIDVDVVFPIMHGVLYEDGCLQGLLELANIAYVGCDVKSSSISMDKDMVRKFVCNNNICCVQYQVISYQDTLQYREKICKEIVRKLNFPLFIKPCSSGSSIGVRKVDNFSDLITSINYALLYDEYVLIEEYIAGREIELSVLENLQSYRSPYVSVPGEIRTNHPDKFYSYAAKYIDIDKTELIIPALINKNTINILQNMAKEIFINLKCRGMARIDFFIENNLQRIYFNEVNTIPGFTNMSMYPKTWEMSGLSYSNLLDKLIELAIIHGNNKKFLIDNYKYIRYT